jgi:hypothetical protein
MDPELRIRTEQAYQAESSSSHPRIVEVMVSSGFFQEEALTLHPSQNCLIGGQGVGKSLLVEFVRFALDQLSTVDAVNKDTESKLAQQLGTGGVVRLRVQVPSGTNYEITRTYDGRKNPTEVINTDTGDYYEGHLSQLFPIIAYSQTEAVHISREPRAQLDLIDRFIDAPAYQTNISRLADDLRKSDHRVAHLVESRDNLTAVTKQLSTTKEAIANIEKALESPILAQMKAYEEQGASFREQLTFLDEVHSAVAELSDDIQQSFSAPAVPKKHQGNPSLVEAQRISKMALKEVGAGLSSALSKVEDHRKEIARLHKEWRPALQKVQGEYDAFIAKAGGDQKGLASRRKKLEGEKEDLEDQAKALASQATQFDKAWKARFELLDQLDGATTALYLARKAKYDDLTALSAGRLMLGISKASDTEDYAAALAAIATGTRIRKADLTLVAAHISPRALVDAVFARDPSAISSKAPIEEDTAQKLVSWLGALEAQEDILALQHQFLPQDTPSISFRKDDGSYHPISDLSVGQKCTALLIIALSASNHPIVIDQPEEAIDIASVFADIVTKLRATKQGRQFILTTHNPNIAVTADSDLIHVLKASATKGTVVHRGAIEDDSVREEVINHLEGGRAPYLMRGKKYGLIPQDSSE